MARRKELFAINWMEVEALVNGRHDNPHHLLGMHQNMDDVFINVYLPNAKVVRIREITNNAMDAKQYTLVSERYPGFFSLVVKNRRKFDYEIIAKYEDGTEKVFIDPYVFEPVIDPIDVSRFNEGVHYEIYDKLGAHPMTVDGVSGVLFAVWAPNAERVSVVGNFNDWDGRVNPMRKIDYSGIFELFIPGDYLGEIYKYEIRSKQGTTVMKADPYAFSGELRPANASRIVSLNYVWNDKKWMTKRAKKAPAKEALQSPMNIYEVHLGSWKRPTDGREFYNYREIVQKLAAYMKEMGYNYVELMPVMEHPFDPSWGYQITGYYAPTSRYGDPEDFMFFVDYMHNNGIGVIIDWVPAHFPKDEYGLGRFDGTALYEHENPLLGEHPHWGTYIFNYDRNEVKNFLVANALYWADKYHVDGIRVDAVASMLYLDYGRTDGNWIPNKNGGNENLGAIEFLKEVNALMAEKHKGVLMIAEESTAWPAITTSVADGGLGFDFKWNMGWMNDYLGYMKLDPLYRKYHHDQLTFSLMYAFSENFVLVLSHDEVVHEKGSMIGKMPGSYEDKFSNLRVAYGYMMTHPGKKLLFMGQEFAQFKEFSEAGELDWSLFEFDAHICMLEFVKKLNKLYQTEPALYELDTKPEGFNWIDCDNANESIISFERHGKDEKDTLLIVCNFTPIEHNNYKLAVPESGKWKEIFSSDLPKYGGDGKNNKAVKTSKKVDKLAAVKVSKTNTDKLKSILSDETVEKKDNLINGREDYIEINVPSLSISVFKKKD